MTGLRQPKIWESSCNLRAVIKRTQFISSSHRFVLCDKSSFQTPNPLPHEMSAHKNGLALLDMRL